MAHVRAECLPELLVATLGDQVTIDVAQGRKMTVRIVDAVVGAAVVGGHQFVRAGCVGLWPSQIPARTCSSGISVPSSAGRDR
jgi:hypothetical protein